MKAKLLDQICWPTLTALVALVLAPLIVNATPLAPGGAVVPNVAASNPLTAGVIIANTGVQNFNVTGGGGQDFSGTAQEWVVKNWAGNPFGPSADAFVLQVALGSPAQTLASVTNAAFGTFLTDVTYFGSSGGQIAPGSAGRNTSGQVGFNFSPGIQPGQRSELLIVSTDATTFTAGTLQVLDSLTATLNGFAPAGPTVPESGGAVALLAVGMVALALMRWRSSATEENRRKQ